ncbi:CatB-related O-acetyltransferase [Rhodalgimonas zhirmunskyi]|uniref:CatB-related O-acetyltransferase n=1 Tax=Rhodalgimonas zhirmunskyi TaxID=2964767 RepID=A0AAJ1UHD8_9RHOB|nr:CatB-related O-acetyltransferase [Rhodoalgimonas zhirmunskyi]MDQ2095957.1 CatB-related O-acetyltransferase [Rhodoalgimonas zhirmunskyi]
MPRFPTSDTRNPLPLPDGSVHEGTVFLKAVIDHPRFIVGDFSYASTQTPPEDWVARLAPYLFDFAPERLVIGKFCQIADGVKFITASANHRYDGFSSYPFAVFHGEADGAPSIPTQGPDTIIGNDVWIGQGARILPGARLGDGCIVGAGAVVAGNVPAYSIIAGNPARVLRRRFDDATIETLQRIAWWDWPIDRIVAAEAAICGADIAALMKAAGG